jgi:putative ABC transport system permease protein
MARGVMELLEEINRAGTTIVMVTHDPELAARAAQRAHRRWPGHRPGARPGAGHGIAAHAALRARTCSPTTSDWRAQLPRNKVLTALMVLAIALGIGASMTTLTVFHVLSGDPIPARASGCSTCSSTPRAAATSPARNRTRPDPLRRRALLRDKGKRQALMSGGGGTVEPDNSTLKPFVLSMRWTSADFFPMFDVPCMPARLEQSDDDAHARVVVISRKLNDKLFGGQQRRPRVRLEAIHCASSACSRSGTQAALLRPHPAATAPTRPVLPFNTAMDLKLGSNGNMNCFGARSGRQPRSTRPVRGCSTGWSWTARPGRRLQGYLDNYSEQQRAAGRFERPANVRLRDVMEWLDFKNVVPGDVRLQMWLAFGFLRVCLVNTVGLLLAKFLRRSGEIGVRRALGASRAEIFLQCLVEAGRSAWPAACSASAWPCWACWRCASARPVTRNWRIWTADAALTFALALLASLLAGLLPAWRAMRIVPAIQLKSQYARVREHHGNPPHPLPLRRHKTAAALIVLESR